MAPDDQVALMELIEHPLSQYFAPSTSLQRKQALRPLVTTFMTMIEAMPPSSNTLPEMKPLMTTFNAMLKASPSLDWTDVAFAAFNAPKTHRMLLDRTQGIQPQRLGSLLFEDQQFIN